jgi:putative transposase
LVTLQTDGTGNKSSSFGLENASMPWKESRASDERLKFIAEVLSGNASMAELCRRFDISRKTRYKRKKRYEVGGMAALVDFSRRSHGHPNAMPESMRKCIIELRQQQPTWGARKIRVPVAAT